MTADPQTGQIRVDTARYAARFDDGVLTYLYNPLSEEIAERSGQVAAMGYEPSLKPSLNASSGTPAIILWKTKAALFAHRGLHPFYPVQWEPNVMSYLKAEDGTVFVYEKRTTVRVWSNGRRTGRTCTMPAHGKRRPSRPRTARCCSGLGAPMTARGSAWTT